MDDAPQPGDETVVDEDGERARAKARTEVAMNLDIVGELDPTVELPLDVMAEVRAQLAAGEPAAAGLAIPDELLDRFAFSGTPEHVPGLVNAVIAAGAKRSTSARRTASPMPAVSTRSDGGWSPSSTGAAGRDAHHGPGERSSPWGALTVRRILAYEHGEPLDVLRVAEIPAEPREDDSLADDAVCIECHAVGLNYLDLMRCRGTYPLPPAFPLSFGVEVAGRVVAAAPACDELVGREVLACPALPAGALGDRVVVPVRLVIERPADIDPITAAALPVNYQTAWFGLERAGIGRRAAIGDGTTVLVTAAAGGVGVAATQLAAERGATVIAAAGGAAKVEVCAAQGAHIVVDYLADDLGPAVLDATSGRGVDVVLDQVGGELFARLLDLVAFRGALVAIGSAGGPIAPVDPTQLAARNVSVIGLSWGSAYPTQATDEVAACYSELFDLCRRGLVCPLVSDVVALDEAPAALAALGDRRTVGKVLVDLDRGRW